MTALPAHLAPSAAGGFDWMELLIKPLLPVPALLLVLPALWWLFRETWRELDASSLAWRNQLAADGRSDYRPLVALVTVAVVLTLQEYYGGRQYFDQAIRPLFVWWAPTHPKTIQLAKYDDLYGFGWWALTRVVGYIAPLAVWRIAFPEESILDMGFRTHDFFKHAWIYGLFLAAVLPAMLIVASHHDFGSYYPFYKESSRSWFDFLCWEAMYFAQFFALEVFFRGFILGALRKSFGSGAIFAMAVPYCMIHYGKPFLEVNGAIIAGIALGSLSMKTKSIYQGFFVHITVAALMDWLSLWHRHALPTTFWSP